MPSITYFAPWLFEAVYQLSNHYQSGKLIAYKTICRIGIKSTCNLNNINYDPEYDSVSDEFMDLFYLTIHQGLHSDDKVFYFFFKKLDLVKFKKFFCTI